jgi:phospholipid/cholesterol/gamma-HCH transport system substrate-binding protein
MFLRPKTGLNDMSIQLDPGHAPAPRLGSDDVLPVSQTRPQVNADEVLAELDADTRGYLASLANEGGRGLHGRGVDLRALLKATGPTLAQTERITHALVDRRAQVRRLVGNLRLLSEATAGKDTQLAQLIDGSSATFGALADQEANLRASLERLPGTLDATERALSSGQRFARRLGPTLERLRPAARQLAPTLREVRPLLREAEPIVRTQLRPLVHDAVPLVDDLRPAVADLRATTPLLVRAFDVLTYVTNELGYNPPGPEEGYLFWLAWFDHNANSILSIEDAHGVAWRGQLIASCSTYAALPQLSPLLALAVGTPVCPPEKGG